MIYIVEDDDAIRELEQYALQSSGYEVSSFESAEPFWQAMHAAEPELVILDVMLPGEDGFSILKKLRNTPSLRRLPIIMVTAKSSELDTVRGLDCGADDYITKPFNILEVKARIKAIIRRSNAGHSHDENPKLLTYDVLKVDCDSRRAYIDEKEVNLTAKEFDLLELLMVHPNKVYSREELLNTVWGYDYPGDVRTVDVHIRRLREKIESKPSDPKYIHTKWGVGYYFQK